MGPLAGIDSLFLENVQTMISDLELPLLFGVLFGFVAALMAFLIIYDEYQRYRLAPRRLLREALTTGGLAFGIFVVLSLIVGYWASHLIR